jgi:hypothetical protein
MVFFVKLLASAPLLVAALIFSALPAAATCWGGFSANASATIIPDCGLFSLTLIPPDFATHEQCMPNGSPDSPSASDSPSSSSGSNPS